MLDKKYSKFVLNRTILGVILMVNLTDDFFSSNKNFEKINLSDVHSLTQWIHFLHFLLLTCNTRLYSQQTKVLKSECFLSSI